MLELLSAFAFVSCSSDADNSSDGKSGSDEKTENAADVTNASVKIVKSEGWLNSAYVIFEQLDGASYKVLCDEKEIDDSLIRYYDEYVYYEQSESADLQVSWTKKSLSNVVRADALGLASGEHTIKVAAVSGNTRSEYSVATMNVSDHDRSGFAFTSNNMPGAYKADGTLKDGAVVIYVSGDTAKTVSYTSTGKKANTYTGLQDILSEANLKNLSVPLDIRIVGTISKDQMDSLGSSEEGLQIKTTAGGVTVEGVGHDASITGFGFLIRGAKYVEVSNLGIYNFMDDGISIDTNNSYLWIHNNDISYGGTGKDADQAKGDGSLDFKKSTYSTLSYNHFWDSGKCNLLDASPDSNGSNYLSYHHNWYDHSDSRHPRIRNASAVHVYNNYYDGNAKYGVGVTSGSSAFVEGNYFRDANDPMMSSKQGTDATGSGTFSGEDGGVIKAWNNFIGYNTANTVHFVTNKYRYGNNASGEATKTALGADVTNAGKVEIEAKSGSSSVSLDDIDAYEVDSREQKVPESVITKAGGTGYSNFDTEMGLSKLGLSSVPSNPEQAKADVMKYSGRHNPDFAYTFNNVTEDKNYGVITGLKTQIVSYKSSLTKIQGGGSSSSAE